MKIREKRPGGDFVENVFGDSPHLASSFGGQSDGDDAGVYKSLQTNVSNCEQKIVQKKAYPISAEWKLPRRSKLRPMAKPIPPP